MRSAMLVLLLSGCGQAGSLAVTITGEDAAVNGYPEGAFADGWTLHFDDAIVSIGTFELRAQDGDDAMLASDSVLVDLHEGDALAWTFEGVPARRWDDVRYRIRAPSASTRDLGAIDPSIRQRMIDEGIAIYVRATAGKDGATRRIEWAFVEDVAHSRCENPDGTDGLIVTAGGQNDAFITIHWDHLFFDSLALDSARMRFDAIAAVAGDDGLVTLDELSAQPLADLHDASGGPLLDDTGARVVYDPGSSPLSEPTLRGMIEVVATTIGHFDGEGHCHYVASP